MAAAEDQDDVTSLSEYRRTDRQAAFVRTEPGYVIKAIPVIQSNGGTLVGYVYQSASQGPLHSSEFEMDDETQEALGLPDSVRESFNEVINQPFAWPPALA